MAEVIQVDHVTGAKEGDLRVWWFHSIPGVPRYTLVGSPTEAATVLAALTQEDLANPAVTDNAGGLEVFEDGKWSEWYDEEGDDIDAFMEGSA